MLRTNPQTATAKVASILLFALAVMPTQLAQAQTFTVLHSFTGGAGGASPNAGVTLDAAGNVYGTTVYGGNSSNDCADGGTCGTVFRLKHGGSGWILDPLYAFHGEDGGNPTARVIFGPDGTLYGTTSMGGYQMDGTVFNLRPSATACKNALCPWTETLVHEFMAGQDGCVPGFGDLIFDTAGHLYGTTVDCGYYNSGAVFEVAKLPSGSWLENINYNFGYLYVQAQQPEAGVILDGQGNLYTTTPYGGSGGIGTVVQLVNSPSGWTETDLHSFTDGSDGGFPYAGLIFDDAGNLYGATWYGGSGGGGAVFELTPSDGGWTFTVIHSFTGAGPWASLTMDAAGNLYGTTVGDGAYGNGSVFKLTQSNGSWTYTSLHDFTGGGDGTGPVSNVTFDSSGNLYGTTSEGGTDGNGVVWEITP
jgi:uncharacterized repeat protein (TIGR03803 family)